MNYEDIIRTVSEIMDNELIATVGLTLVYEVDPIRHKQIDEELYIKINETIDGFEHNEVVEIEIGEILVKFIKTGTKITYEDLED